MAHLVPNLRILKRCTAHLLSFSKSDSIYFKTHIVEVITFYFFSTEDTYNWQIRLAVSMVA